jgi:predicted DNA binding CopG/RHH family protein
MDENRPFPISKARSLQEAGAFWDEHDLTDFDTDRPDVEFDISCSVPIELDLLTAIEEQAHQRGVNLQTLVNLWLSQKLDEQRHQVAG